MLMQLTALDPQQWILAAIAAIVLGIGKTGLPGITIVGVPLMATAFGGKDSVGILLPMLIVADCFAVAWYRRHARWDRLWRLFPWVLPGFALGALVLWAVEGLVVAGMSGQALFKPLIGFIVLSMLGLNLARRRWGERLTPHHPASIGATGTAAGAATTLANAAGPIMAIYLAAMRLPKEQFMGTNAWFFLLVNLSKVPIYVALTVVQPESPMFTAQTLLFDLCMVPLIVCGVFVGRWLLPRISQRAFDLAILALAALAALRLLLDPLFA
jgi:uncharacterized membrane protein YfcA